MVLVMQSGVKIYPTLVLQGCNGATPKAVPLSTHSIKFCNSRVFPHNYLVFFNIK